MGNAAFTSSLYYHSLNQITENQKILMSRNLVIGLHGTWLDHVATSILKLHYVFGSSDKKHREITCKLELTLLACFAHAITMEFSIWS